MGHPKTGWVASPESVKTFTDALYDGAAGNLISTRLGEVGSPNSARRKITNILTYIKKVDRHCSDLHLADSYAWLADMSHPSAGSNMAFWDRESSQTTYVHSYGASRRPVPFVAETSDAVARGILIACGLLEIGGKRIRSLLDDMALTSELAFVCNDELLLGRTSRPSRNDPCPCGSGRKFKACGHDWGKPALPTTGVMPSFTVTGFGICQAQ
jgi:hypothetical protein